MPFSVLSRYSRRTAPVSGNNDFLEEKAGQARDDQSVGRTGFRENDYIRMANGPASMFRGCLGHKLRVFPTARSALSCHRSPQCCPTHFNFKCGCGKRVIFPFGTNIWSSFTRFCIPHPVRTYGELHLAYN
jgi:hypothetical protein